MCSEASRENKVLQGLSANWCQANAISRPWKARAPTFAESAPRQKAMWPTGLAGAATYSGWSWGRLANVGQK
eukprot:12739678-Alexandrium_andersonii.AAC.1